METPRRAGLAAALAGIAFFLSGAAGLVYQVSWQRILALHSGVGIYSIAIIVAAFMFGLGLGSWLGGRWSVRFDGRRSLQAFGLVELRAVGGALHPERVLRARARDHVVPAAGRVGESHCLHLRHRAGLVPPRRRSRLRDRGVRGAAAGAAAAFLLLPCLLLTYSGAAVASLATLPPDLPGYRWLVGYWSQGSGFKLGLHDHTPTLLALYGLLPALMFGLPTFLMGLSFPALQRAVHDEVRTSGRKVGFLQAANIAGCVAGSLAVGLLLLRWLGKDATTVCAVVPQPNDRWAVFVNGRTHSWLPFGGVHTQIGAATAMVHPAPLDVAIIGLGSGDTAWAAACRPETRSLTVFEIAGPQPVLLSRLARTQDVPGLRSFLEDPRLYVVGTEQRAVIIGSNEPIVVDKEAWKARLYSPAVLSYLGRHNADDAMRLLQELRPVDVKRRPRRQRELNLDRATSS